MIDVSIIIVSWNTRDILRQCLQSIYEQTVALEYEVIIIDNASTDGSAEMIKTQFPKAILVENTINKGFAAANNQAIVLAKGRFILLLNPDTIVLNNAINKSILFADQNQQAAVIGCKVFNPDGTLQPTCFMFPSLLNMFLSSSYLYKLFPKSRFFGRERMTWWDRDDVREVDVVTGCFMLVRRSAIEQIGLLDERFFMYGEETDWCYRFKQAGWKVVFTPVAEIIHLGSQSSKKIREKMIVQVRLSILYFISKHYGWLSHKIAALLVVLFFAARVPVWLIVYVFGNAYKKIAAVKLRAYISGIKQVLSPSRNSLIKKESI
jgi:GT2 family glycosyltransferase